VPPAPGCPATGLASPEVTRASCLVPSASFSHAPGYALPVHLCRFRVRSVMPGLFPGPLPQPAQSSKGGHGFGVVTSGGPRSLDLVPIGYGSRPRLRGRLTLRGSAWRRNPWTSGGRGSRPPVATHVRMRTSHASTAPRGCGFAGLGNAPLPRAPALDGGDASTASAPGLSPATFSPRDSC
jgi:hypothetical protein